MSRPYYNKTHTGLPNVLTRPSNRSIESGISAKTFNFPSSKKAQAYKISEEEGQKVAERVFDHYDRDRSGKLKDEQIASMLKDAYRGIKKDFTPTQEEIDSYRKVLDRNCDGDVTCEDMEETVQKYFCAEEDLPSESFSRRDIACARFI